MAYNPFNVFRRNTKALMAVLVVFIMIMFTLQSGVAGGDFFETVAKWLGSKGGGTVVCKIDGRKITDRELDGDARSLRYKRLMANKFMSLAAVQTQQSLEGYLSDQRSRVGPEGQQTIDGTLGLLRELPRFAQQPGGLEQIINLLPGYANSLNTKIDSPTAREEDKEAARVAQRLILLLRTQILGGGRHYFLNAPNRNQNDLIEFVLWQKKADQMGIKFGREDVKRLIQTEFALMFKNDVPVRAAMTKETQGFTLEKCYDALAEEFRVRAAQTAVMGSTGRHGEAPVYSTPYEAFEYYRDQTSPSAYSLLAVPAAAFVPQVTEVPTEAQLVELFKKHETAEPNPKNETPGFKLPRKLAIAFLGITGEEPYYKKLAEEQIKVGEVMAKVSGVFTVPVAGVGPAWNAAAAAPLTLKEPAVDAAYNAYKNLFEYHRNKNYEKSTLTPKSKFSSFDQDDPLLPTSAVKPGTVAATLGAFVGQAASHGNPAAAATLAATAPLAYEIRDRVKVGVPFALSAMPTPALLQSAVGGIAQYEANLPKPLPIEAVRPELIKEAIPKRAKALALGGQPDPTNPSATTEKGDLDNFIAKLEEMSDKDKTKGRMFAGGVVKPKDKAAVEKYIAEFAAARGLTVGKSTEPRDEWALETDPALAPLVAAHDKERGLTYKPFGREFFVTITGFDQNTFRPTYGPTSDTFIASRFATATGRDPFGPTTHYVTWRTEDVAPAKRGYGEAKPDVIAAWKHMKARDKAREHAERVAAAVRDQAGADPSRVLRDFRQGLIGIAPAKTKDQIREVFPIDPVAPFVPGPGGRVQPFGLSESANIPYPTRDMVSALLDNREKPLKTAFVLADAPKDTYYVAVLTNRTPKQPSEFRVDAYSQTGTAQGMLGEHRREAARKSHESVIALLKQEFKFEATDEQKKKLEENAKSGSRDE